MNKIKIKDYLTENIDVAVDVARELNGWDGSFPEVDIWDMADLVQCFCCDYESTRKFMDTVLDSLDTLDRCKDYVRFSEYGDYLESVDMYEVEEEVADMLDEIIDQLEQHYPNHIDIYDNVLKELLEDEFDVEAVALETYEKAEQMYKSSEITVDILMRLAHDMFGLTEDQEEELEDYFFNKYNYVYFREETIAIAAKSIEDLMARLEVPAEITVTINSMWSSNGWPIIEFAGNKHQVEKYLDTLL